ncbi:hypothetical protein PR202_gb19849 [Eleusine coracana subsp. coracana]|uniref:40S ribosomal protein S21 n=1 Tax=Eleusine coracana subsp. coracana TaxID=191504 RepID=A0AAV5F716_ELECO|nr:hypothetical protein PR202_gb19849 [Eleusine coracana subsp. coracana]
MQNEEGKMVDLYVPRKCSATNRIITAKDHASVQINIGHLDENGMYNGQFTAFALSGFVRAQVIISCPCNPRSGFCIVMSSSVLPSCGLYYKCSIVKLTLFFNVITVDKKMPSVLFSLHPLNDSLSQITASIWI